MQYLIMDGRANENFDDAQVIEIFEANSNIEAILYTLRNYKNEDVALVDENNELV